MSPATFRQFLVAISNAGSNSLVAATCTKWLSNSLRFMSMSDIISHIMLFNISIVQYAVVLRTKYVYLVYKPFYKVRIMNQVINGYNTKYMMYYIEDNIENKVITKGKGYQPNKAVGLDAIYGK